MESERELYRTRVFRRWLLGGRFGSERNYAKLWGDCILSNQSLVVIWDNGDVLQCRLNQIHEVHVSPEGRYYTRGLKKDYPGVMNIYLSVQSLEGHENPLVHPGDWEWESQSARELMAQIQKARLSF